jgi:hypothetical protein
MKAEKNAFSLSLFLNNYLRARYGFVATKWVCSHESAGLVRKSTEPYLAKTPISF